MRHPLPMPGGPHNGLREKGTIMPHLREGKGGCEERITYQGQSWDSARDYPTSTLEASPAPGQSAPKLFHNFLTLCGMFVVCLPFPSKIHETVQCLSVLPA